MAVTTVQFSAIQHPWFCCKKGGEMGSSASIQEAAEKCPS
jgi:hypothetical protein